MKNLKNNIVILFITVSISFGLFSEEITVGSSITDTDSFVPFTNVSGPAHNVQIDEKTGFPLILKKPFPVFDYGLTTSIVTRVTKKNNKSNFVEDHYFLGAYVAMQSRNMEPLDSIIRLAVYYPVAYKFNKVPNAMHNMLNFGIDLFAAPYINLSLWHYLTFDLGGGLHFLFEQSDDYNFINLGLGAFARINMPVARRWSLFIDGYASLDYANLGTNGPIEPVDFAWQYQVAVGFRYSKKAPNKYSYIPSKRTYEEDIQLLVDKQELKNAKKEQKAEEKRLKKEAKEMEKNRVLEITDNPENDFLKIESALNEDVDAFDNADE